MYKPKQGKNYWMINSRFEIRETTHSGGAKSLKRIEVGNCFKTAKEARQFKSLVVGKALDIQKIDFDKRIAFAYGFITALFIGGLIWSVIR